MIVGARVEQHSREDDLSADLSAETKVLCAGTVVACERGGAPAAYHALVMLDDGSLREIRAELLTVLGLAPTKSKSSKP